MVGNGPERVLATELEPFRADVARHRRHAGREARRVGDDGAVRAPVDLPAVVDCECKFEKERLVKKGARQRKVSDYTHH